MLRTREAIETRRSIRKFKSDPIPVDVMDALLDAARLAPSGCNAQPWRFKIVRDEETKHKLGVLKIVAAALLLSCTGCSVTKGFTEATYNHLNQGAPLTHAEYQQERSRISGGDEGKRP